MLFKDHFQTQLNQKIKTCEECFLKDNPGPVVGYGSIEADVMFISDVPGETEAKTGIPFTGKAKDLMVGAIKDNELKKGEYYLTYLIKHSLNGQTAIHKYEHKQCLDFLLSEIELVNPRVICSMGYYTTTWLMTAYGMNNTKNLSELRGRGIVIPALWKRNKKIRPMRYIVTTWNPATENDLMIQQFKNDVISVKFIRMLSPILFDPSRKPVKETVDKMGISDED